MFSSHAAFNTDPKPYLMWLRDGRAAHPVKRFARKEDAVAELAKYGGDPAGGAVQTAPRDEFNHSPKNPVNPALIELRDNIARQPEHVASWVSLYELTLEWEQASVGKSSWRNYTPETLAYIDHALRVIRKWKAVYGE